MATAAAKDNRGDDLTDSKASSPAAQETSPKPYNFFNSKDRKEFPVPCNGSFDTLKFLDSVSDFILINGKWVRGVLCLVGHGAESIEFFSGPAEAGHECTL